MYGVFDNLLLRRFDDAMKRKLELTWNEKKTKETR